MDDKKHDVDETPKPTPTAPEKAGLKLPRWMDRPITHPDHATELEHASAVNEFRDKLPRRAAEDRAYEEYIKRQHTEAAAFHLAGMKAAHAAGDLEAARKHSLMYGLHSKALDHEPVGPAHPSVVSHLEKTPQKVYRFKAHRGDMLAVSKKDDTEQEGVSKAEALYSLYRALEPLTKATKGYAVRPSKGSRSIPPQCVRKDCHHKGHHVHDRVTGDIVPWHFKDVPEETVAKSDAAWAKAELAKKAPPGFSEETMHKLKREHGVESAFKIAWAAHNKQTKKAEMPAGKKKVMPCRCDAYSHPHRTGGGKCPAGK